MATAYSAIVCRLPHEITPMFSCTPDSELRGGVLIVGQDSALVRRSLDPFVPGRQLTGRSGKWVIGVDFDCETERIYWSDGPGRGTLNV